VDIRLCMQAFFVFFVFFGEGLGLKHRGPHSTSLLSHMFGKCSILQNRTFHFELVLCFSPKWWGNQIGSLQKKKAIEVGMNLGGT
jgi:hypothetical protein